MLKCMEGRKVYVCCQDDSVLLSFLQNILSVVLICIYFSELEEILKDFILCGTWLVFFFSRLILLLLKTNEKLFGSLG